MNKGVKLLLSSTQMQNLPKLLMSLGHDLFQLQVLQPSGKKLPKYPRRQQSYLFPSVFVFYVKFDEKPTNILSPCKTVGQNALMYAYLQSKRWLEYGFT